MTDEKVAPIEFDPEPIIDKLNAVIAALLHHTHEECEHNETIDGCVGVLVDIQVELRNSRAKPPQRAQKKGSRSRRVFNRRPVVTSTP